MQQWEYLYVRLHLTDEVKCTIGTAYASRDEPAYLPDWEGKTLFSLLNALGQDAWELIEAPYTIEEKNVVRRFIFKRPLNKWNGRRQDGVTLKHSRRVGE
jgi:hypothetical protein